MEMHPVWHDSCLIFSISGDLSKHGLAEVFYEALLAEAEGKAKEIIVDLSAASVPGSRFIARLVDLVRTMHEIGVVVRLRIITNAPVYHIVTLFSLDRIFDSIISN